MFELTNGQRELKDLIVKWYNRSESEDFVYSGAAGTGKTSVLPYIINEIGLQPDEVIFATFTGKAASVLMQKGFDASTIHSAFFDLKELPLIIDGRPIMKNGRKVTKMRFVEKDFIDDHIKLIVLDEWSMINEDLMKVIYKHGVPVIASGDKYQLRPITGDSLFADRIRFELTEITRQSKYSGIIQLATQIREGKELPHYQNYYNTAHIMSKDFITDSHLLNADIILTAKNKTRNTFNNKIRGLHGSYGNLPNVGDKLICRKNNWNMALNGIPLVNGILGKCIHPIRRDECNLSQNIFRMDFQPDYITDEFEYYEALRCDYGFLNEPCGNKDIDEWNRGAKMEFAEAITVHLSQGSEFPNVLYWDEWVGDRAYMQQLRYTAVTRAQKNVYMFI